MFDDILERKKGFLDSMIRKLKKSKNHNFSMFLVKNLKFFQNVFDDILDILERKKAFFKSRTCSDCTSYTIISWHSPS